MIEIYGGRTSRKMPALHDWDASKTFARLGYMMWLFAQPHYVRSLWRLDHGVLPMLS